MAILSDTLDKPVNQSVKSDENNPAVRQFLRLIAENTLQRSNKDTIRQAIKSLYEEAFIVKNPDGTKQISAQLLYQAIWKTAGRMKPLDFALHGTGRPMPIEQVVTAGVGTVMDKGGYDSSLRDKGGAFFDLLMYGDGFVQVGANPKKKSKIPIVFNPIPGDAVFTDNFATGMRTQGWGRNATKAVIVFKYSWGDFLSTWPEMERKAIPGLIPRFNEIDDITRTDEQEASLEDEIEVAYGYDIVNNNFTIFAGGGLTVIEELDGGDYPFIMDGESYIPLLQFICMPAAEGFWNHGIGALLYRIAIIQRRLMNMEINHINDNVYPTNLVSVPHEQSGAFFQKLQAADQMRAAGKKPYVVMERDPSDPNSAVVSSQTLLGQNLINEWQIVWTALTREVRRLGIDIDQLEPSSSTTATEILANEENANSFVKQVMEYNSSESQFAADLTMDFIKQFVSKNDKTPLNLTTQIVIEGESVRADFVTLGQVSEELKKHNYFAIVNSRSGAIPSNLMLRVQAGRAFQLAQPGSAAQKKLISTLTQLDGIDIPSEEFFAQEAQAVQETVGEDLAAGAPSETDRLTFLPQRADQQVAI